MRWSEHAADRGPTADLCPGDASQPPDAALNAGAALLQGADDRTVYVVDGTPVSLSDLRAIASFVAGALAAAGVGPGSRVLLRLSDSPELAGSLLAVFSLGAIAIPTFVQYGPDELRYRVDDAEVRAIVVETALQAAAHEAAQGRQVAVLVLVPGGHGAVEGLQRADPVSPVAARADDLALILYTSGSTGKPKGTCHSHGDLLAVCDTYGAATLALRESDVIAGAAAMPFALGFALFFLYPLRFGCVAVLDADKSPDRCLDHVERHRPTLLVGVATYYAMLLRRLTERGAVDLTCLRGCLTGGERVTESLTERWREQTGQVLTQFLGTTELLGCFLGGAPGVAVAPAAIGPPVPGYEVVVRSPETHEPVAEGVPGLLSVRGPTSTKYWRRPDKQREAVSDGWNLVPDVVYLRDGLVHFVGRQDDVIKSAGFRISPTQVEEVLEQHPTVLECACVGARDPEGVRPEVIKACVVLRDPDVASDELKRDLQGYVKSCAAPYLYPRIVEFVEVLPRTASGKLLRSALRDRP